METANSIRNRILKPGIYLQKISGENWPPQQRFPGRFGMCQGLEFIPTALGDVGVPRSPRTHEVFLGYPHSQRFSQHGIGMWVIKSWNSLSWKRIRVQPLALHRTILTIPTVPNNPDNPKSLQQSPQSPTIPTILTVSNNPNNPNNSDDLDNPNNPDSPKNPNNPDSPQQSRESQQS